MTPSNASRSFFFFFFFFCSSSPLLRMCLPSPTFWTSWAPWHSHPPPGSNNNSLRESHLFRTQPKDVDCEEAMGGGEGRGGGQDDVLGVGSTSTE
ncbi:hypothetical protein F4802DRAFT_310335 [Xylaria palmicola]|nr:hypothetical protein F4802DRAFT_310335 [Xylaria palmicola]